MGMTITEKMLARASGRGTVEAGEIVRVKVVLVMGHDVTLPLSILEFKRMGAGRVYDREKVAVCDHFAPAANKSAADRIKMVRDFAREQGLEHYFEPGSGQSGVCHAVLAELCNLTWARVWHITGLLTHEQGRRDPMRDHWCRPSRLTGRLGPPCPFMADRLGHGNSQSAPDCATVIVGCRRDIGRPIFGVCRPTWTARVKTCLPRVGVRGLA